MISLEFHIDYTDIGNRIRISRQNQKITQEKLAELAGISIPHLSNIELGKTKLSLPAIVNISNALQVSVDELLCGNVKQGKALLKNEHMIQLEDCSTDELKVINSMVRVMKEFLRKTGGQHDE